MNRPISVYEMETPKELTTKEVSEEALEWLLTGCQRRPMTSGTQLWLDAQLGQRQAQEKGEKGKGKKGGKGGDRGKEKGNTTVTGGRGRGEKGGQY